MWEPRRLTNLWASTACCRVRVRVTLRLAVYRQSVLATSPLRLMTRNIFFSNWTLAVIVLMWHPLWWEDWSVVYNCCWPSPVQSLSGSTPAELVTKILDSPYLEGQALGYTFRLWVTFSSPPMTRRDTVEVFDPASTRDGGELLTNSTDLSCL
jgi:hypothetical protein